MSKIKERIKRLEGGTFLPQTMKEAIERNFKTGELPGNPKLANWIQELRLSLLMMDMSVLGPDGEVHTLESLGFTPTQAELNQARQAWADEGGD